MGEIDFPMYVSLVPTPGYNFTYLETCGVEGEYPLFQAELITQGPRSSTVDAIKAQLKALVGGSFISDCIKMSGS